MRTPKVDGLPVPRRRRRTARPVLLVEVPPAGAEGSRAAERFLRALHRARATMKDHKDPFGVRAVNRAGLRSPVAFPAPQA